MSEMRWHPLLNEWVITATHRQERTFLPPPGYCPLCPTVDGGFPTEVPRLNYEFVVFENKFPSLQPDAAPPAVSDSALAPTRPATGVCEVVLYCPEHSGSLTDLPLEKTRQLVSVWKDRYEELGSRQEVDYVFIFENKGEAVGVTISHPHGQIYAFPYKPPRIEKSWKARASIGLRQGAACIAISSAGS